jgi:hypothetical protein
MIEKQCSLYDSKKKAVFGVFCVCSRYVGKKKGLICALYVGKTASLI